MLVGRIEIGFLLALLYLAISANFEPLNLVVGAAIGVLLTLLLRPRWRSRPTGPLHRRLWALLRYQIKMGWEIFVNGLYVARIVLTPSLPIHPGILRIESRSTNEAIQALSAHGISITPGEIVMHIATNGDLYIHCVDIRRSLDTAQPAQTKRCDWLESIFN